MIFLRLQHSAFGGFGLAFCADVEPHWNYGKSLCLPWILSDLISVDFTVLLVGFDALGGNLCGEMRSLDCFAVQHNWNRVGAAHPLFRR